MDGREVWKRFLKSGSYRRQLLKYECLEVNNDCKSSSSAKKESSMTTIKYKEPSESVERTRKNSTKSTVNDLNYDCDYSVEDSAEEVLENSLDYSPDDASESDMDDSENNTMRLTSFIQNWSNEYKIPHCALKPLLNRLCNVDRTLPTDPRRLLGTPRKEPELITIDGGHYWHQGLGIILLLSYRNSINHSANILQIHVSVKYSGTSDNPYAFR